MPATAEAKSATSVLPVTRRGQPRAVGLRWRRGNRTRRPPMGGRRCAGSPGFRATVGPRELAFDHSGAKDAPPIRCPHWRSPIVMADADSGPSPEGMRGVWALDPERIDPDDYPARQPFARLMTWAPCPA